MLPYNNKDITSIFNYSKQLIHKSLRDFAPNASEPKGKGGLGQLVEELFFRYDINNKQEADFAFVNAELKCTPLKASAKNKEFLIKERLVCSMINYAEDWDKSFEQSHFYRKCLIMLIMFYLHQKDVSKLDLHFLFAVLWKIPEKDLLIIRQDYDTIISKIRSGKAETLSEGDTMYLGACRKGQKQDSLMTQHGSDIGAPRRAWSLKTAYMSIVLDEVKKNNEDGAYCNYDLKPTNLEELISVEELKYHTVDDVIKKRFLPYIGLTYTEISKKLEYNPITAKSKYFAIANAIASNKKIGNVNVSEEFLKSGLTMKTIRVNKNGRIKESMSFENIEYQEVYDCNEWTDSRLYELFTSRFLFVIYRETDRMLQLPNGKVEPEYELDKVAFWTMPQADLDVAKEYWSNIRDCIVNDQISPKYFWSIKDKRYFHVRPKATKASDMVDTPQGTRAKKYCYWFNAQYVKNIIDNEI